MPEWCTIESDPGMYSCLWALICFVARVGRGVPRASWAAHVLAHPSPPRSPNLPSARSPVPGVFSELIQKIGVNGVIVDELYSLDDIAATGPCHGLVFLFQYQRSEGKDDRAVIPPGDLPDVFFAKQTVSNACATQAILSILLNRDDVELPPVLADIKSFAPNVPPDVRGDMIGDSDVIRTVHNSFAHPDPFDVEATLPTKKSKAFHFVAYVPVKGTVYELDGLKRGPIAVGHGVSEDTWLSAAGDAIRDRIARLSQGEQLHYSLLALVPDKTDELQARLMSLEGADEPDEVSLPLSRTLALCVSVSTPALTPANLPIPLFPPLLAPSVPPRS